MKSHLQRVLMALAVTSVCTSVSSANRKLGSDEFLQYCGGCHSIFCNRENGPKLQDVIGRKSASVADYDDYSSALKDANFVWTAERLDQWLVDPQVMVPGSKMPNDLPFTRATVKERNKIIQFLMDPDASADICP